MKHKFFILIFFAACHSAFAQAQQASANVMEVKKVIQQLFDAMRVGDSTMLRTCFAPSALLFTVEEPRKGEYVVNKGSVTDFCRAVGTPHPEMWNEVPLSWTIKIDGGFSSVWTDYEFYLGKKYLHCGANAFHLVKLKEGWKIINITDTRRTDCGQSGKGISSTEKRNPFEVEINKQMDEWHMAAARGDEDFFFALMDEDFYYLGTEKGERWDKKSFYDFAIPYFKRKEGAWKFKATSRQIYFTDDLSYAWFEETLDTWMGVCRGTGVLKNDAGQWKLKHYNLCVTVNNDKIQDFIKIKPN